ncbi:fimbria/pilus outer membrane usher protein [Tsuneonella mangrovi]|uniref:fimbria/pilus outer membrane usher protein n=1 Tax=Tsuneonella mangrovi TaxID=1982042 RepID=UPI0014708DFA|nr:fimbria/pilus outer membrane usher protein [Tsuneonella mangrovi]
MTAQSVQQAPGPGLSEIVVDGQRKNRMVDLQGHGQSMKINADDARVAGLPVPDGATGYIPLSALKIYEFSFDSLRQRLTIERFQKADGSNLKDFAVPSDRSGDSRPLTALRIDYDMTASAGSHGSSAGALFDAALVRGNFALGTSVRMTTDPQNGSPAVVRLATSAQIAIADKGIAATMGDFVSAGSQTQRAVRLGGIQVGSDFGLRPDLVTTPLPAFSGDVAVPTTLDVLTADSRYELGKVKPGEFTVRNIPTQPGRGEVSVIMQDALGREIVQTTKFYMSQTLLAPKTTRFAMNAGFVRRRYGEVSNDYGPFAATGFIRRGLSSHLTVEASGEWSPGIANVGARADVVLANVAMLTIEGRASQDGAVGSGGLVNIALESVGRTLSGRVGAIIPTSNYRDVAAHLGDQGPPRQYSAQVSYHYSTNSEIQFSYARQEYRAVPNPVYGPPVPERFNEVFNANLRTQLSKRATLFAGGGMRRTEIGTGYSAAIGLSISFGGQKRGAVQASYNDKHPYASLNYYRDALNDGDIGYRADVSGSDTSQRIAGGATWRSRNIMLDGQIEQVDGSFAGRIDAHGTLLVAGGTVFARNRSGGSYALVRTTGKVEGIPVTRENLLVGKTDKNGLLLVQNIPSQATIKIDVDPDKLPADAIVKETKHLIVVPRRAVALVELDAVHFRPVMRQVVDTSGKPIAAGMPAVMQPSGERTMVGYNGMVEINAAGTDKWLVIGVPAKSCQVAIPHRELGDDDQPPLVCQPHAIVGGPDAPVVAAGAVKDGAADQPKRKVARRDFVPRPDEALAD